MQLLSQPRLMRGANWLLFIASVVFFETSVYAAPAVTTTQAAQALAGLSVPFEENRGQADAKVAFQAKTMAGPLFVTKTGELVWSLTNHLHPPHSIPPSPVKERGTGGEVEVKNYPPHSPLDRREVKAYSVVEKFVGGTPKPAGKTAATTQVNYFHGNDTSKWHSSVPTWQQVSLGEVWPGIEVSIAARGNNAEKLFTVAPGADVSKIAVEVAGGELSVATDGGLQVDLTGFKNLSGLTFTAPVAWQEINGERKPVTVAYQLKTNPPHSPLDRREVKTTNSTPPSPVMERGPGGEVIYGFTLGSHDATQPVIIDPLLQSTYLGGSSNDYINAMAVTADAVYVAGYTLSSDFPGTTGGAQANYGGGSYDAFVAKLNLDLTSLTQASFLGGSSSHDYALDLAVTSNAVYVAGYTYSSNFPAVSGGAQASFGGANDAFVAKLNLDLTTLTQASFLGGSSDDQALALAVTSTAVYVGGYTASSNFPAVSGGAQASFGGGSYDAFVAKLNLDLTTLTQASFLGGSSDDQALAIAVTSSAVYVAGDTASSNFPAVSGGAQASNANSKDGFVAKLNLDLTTLTQASFLGGSSDDQALALAVTSNAVYVDGNTYSSNFPAVNGGAQASRAGGYDAFVAKLNLDLTTLTQASFLGGSSTDKALALAVTSSAVYVAGYTYSSNFPAVNGGAQASYAGGYDAFVAKLSGDLTTLTQASFLGGSSDDKALALAVTSSAVYVAGDTYSSNFPAVNGGAQASGRGGFDGFVAKLTPDLTLYPPLTNGVALTNQTVVAGEWQYYQLRLPTTADRLIFTSSGTGDIDLYTQINALPTIETYLCNSANIGSSEVCDHPTPNDGVWYLGVFGYEDSTFTVKATHRNPQTIGAITFTAASLVAGYTTTASATTNSGLTVTFTSTTPSICSASGTNGTTITALTNGTCTIAANQAGNDNYVPAAQVTANITIVKDNQTLGSITFNPTILTVNGTVTASATATSGLAATFSATPTSFCTVSGTNGATITGVAAGICTVTANQAGNAIYNPAPAVTAIIRVNKASQTITLTCNPLNILLNSSATCNATATSGLTVSLSTSTASICSLNTSNGSVTGIANGVCIINAKQAGDSKYNAAPAVSQNIVVGGNGTRTVTPSAGSGGTVSPNTPQTVNYGATRTFTVTPNTNYLTNPTVSGTCPQGSWNGNIWTTGYIVANCSVNFSFDLKTYTVTSTAGSGGTVTPSTASISHGSIANFTATANSGYVHSNTVGGTCPQGSWNNNVWTTGAIIADCTVKFSFTLPPVNAWLNPFNPTVIRNQPFTLDIIVNSNSLKVGSYIFNVALDTTKLELDSNYCDQGICPGNNALTNRVNIVDDTGSNITLNGTDTQGIEPGNDLQVLTLHFKAKLSTGLTPVNLTTTRLKTPEGGNIGTDARGATVKISYGLCGDSDGNMRVNIIDALAIARKLVTLPAPPTVDVTLADTNKNGRLDINDALFIARYAVGLVLTPEVCAIGQPL